MSDSRIRVEVVFALPTRQHLQSLDLPAGSTTALAIRQSSLHDAFPETEFDTLEIAVWGQVVDPSHVLADGDRVEVLRPLEIDPRDARRRLAQEGQVMGQGGKKPG